jgi:Regulator of ribonuclease activity B
MKYFARLYAIMLVICSGLVHYQVVNAQEPTPDAMALEQLAKSGSDLSKLHHVDFILRFPTLEAANFVVPRLLEFAFVIETKPTKTGHDWLIYASKTMYPIMPDFLSLRDKLEAIAAEGHGTYEGWRAKVVK